MDMLLRALTHEAPSIILPPAPPVCYGDFQQEYDWKDPEFKNKNQGPSSYEMIPLTRGYFMIVSRQDYWHMTHYPDGSPKKWTTKIKLDDEGNIVGVYGCRGGRKNEPRCVYAHREVLGILHSKFIGDHVNTFGLDNRRVNLAVADKGINTQNCVRARTNIRSLGLLRGVELRGKNKKGQQRYGGMRCVRFGKRVKTIRSKMTWLSPKKAAAWYENQMKRLHGRRAWAYNIPSLNYPVFPPLMESEPAPLPRKETLTGANTDIPF